MMADQNTDNSLQKSAEPPQAGSTLLAIAGRLAHMGGWALDLPQNQVHWSPEIYTILEFPPGDEPSLEQVMGLYPPQMRAKAEEVLVRCLRDGTPFDLELQIHTATGRLIDVRVIGEVVRGKNDEIIRLEGALQDISENKRAAKALLESEQRFRQLAEAMPQIVWTGNPDGTVDYLSRGTDDYTGIHIEAEPATRWTMAVHPEDQDLALSAWKGGLDSGEMFQAEYRIISAANNAYRWHLVRGVPIRDEQGKIVKWYGTATDIHDRKVAEERIRKLADRLTATLESITDAFFILDRNWCFAYLNREAERVLQRKRDELISKNIWQEFGEIRESSFYRYYHQALQQNTTAVFEEFFQPLGIWLEVRAYPSEEGLAVYFRDVSAQKQAAMALQRANRALQMISRCNEALIRTEDEEQLLEQVCRLAVEIGGYRLAWVGYKQEDEEHSVLPVAYFGIDDYIQDLQQVTISWSAQHPRGMGPIGRSMRSGEPIVVEDMGQEASMAPWKAIVERHGLLAAIVLPLQQRGQVIGVLVLYMQSVYRPAAEEVELLQELANDLTFGIFHLRTRAEQQRLQAAVLKVAAGVSASTGADFFEQLASRMTEALGAEAGMVVRLTGNEPLTMRTMAVVVDNERIEDFEYQLSGPAAKDFLDDPDITISNPDTGVFAHVQQLTDIGAKTCLGRRLDNALGQPIGLLLVLFREPVKGIDFIRSTLRIFAARAASELERQEADARIREQASLLDKAQDAIIVRDTENKVLYWNKGAERLYGWTAEEMLGKDRADLMCQNLKEFHAATTAVLQAGEWNGELKQRRKNGEPLTVEARWTLVRNKQGQPHSVLSINTDISHRKAAEHRIYQLAFYDPLTQLPNRQLLQDRLQHALAVSAASGHHGALMLLDLDNFKNINDTLGHETGDMLLKEAAKRLRSSLSESDTLARFGGDEFVILLETPTKELVQAMDIARIVGDRILRVLQQPFHLGDHEHHSTGSIGVTMFCGKAHGVDELLKRAELAMYQAKAAGRNTLRHFDPEMQAAISKRANLERDFRRGLRRQEFVLVYQPQVDSNGRISGIEALVRWQPSSREPVSPAQFIPLAEETGLIMHLGRWVLETACNQLAEWDEKTETAGLTMAVNVSARQFHHPDFVAQVLAVLHQTGADPQRLKLELTESLLVEDAEDTIAKITALKEEGIGISLDDFGTGYSSLAYLKRLPLDQLKIDQSFVRDILTDPNDAAIARTIVALGQTLGLSVIAEGVELEAQRDFLASNGCYAYQGYLFSRPLTAQQFEVYLQQNEGGRTH